MSQHGVLADAAHSVFILLWPIDGQAGLGSCQFAVTLVCM